MTSLLMIEDDERLAGMVSDYLGANGFQVSHALDGASGLSQLQQALPELVILDLMLPGISGTEVCKNIRGKSNVPIIMVSAKDGEIDKVLGLELGADDYVTKPFDFPELLARLQALLRRSNFCHLCNCR